MKKFTKLAILTYLNHVTRTSFVVPVTSQERNVAAKFQLDRSSGLAGEVEKGDGRTVRDDNPYITWNVNSR